MNLCAFSRDGLSPFQCLRWFADEYLMTSFPKINKVCVCVCIYTHKFIVNFTDIKDISIKLVSDNKIHNILCGKFHIAN